MKLILSKQKLSKQNHVVSYFQKAWPKQGPLDCDCNHSPAYRKVAQMDFDIQFWKQCCSVMHDWRNFNNVSFKSMMIILHDNSMTSRTPHNLVTAYLCFKVLVFFGRTVEVMMSFLASTWCTHLQNHVASENLVHALALWDNPMLWLWRMRVYAVSVWTSA